MFLDSITNPDLVQHLFGRLRDDVWQLPVTWVVTGNRAERGRYQEPPADCFFDAVVDIGELDAEHAAHLLRRRAEQAGPASARAYRTSLRSLGGRATTFAGVTPLEGGLDLG